MAGWKISVGSDADSWSAVRKYIGHLRDNPQLVCDEAVRCGAPLMLEETQLLDICELLVDAWQSAPQVLEIADSGQAPAVLLTVTGGMPGRVLKEHCRRAIVRLVLTEMHRQGIDVSVREA